MITEAILSKVYPNSRLADRKKYAPYLTAQMQKYGIADVRAVRAFIANVGVESGQLRHNVENLNYSVTGLLSVFGKYFTMEQAQRYSRKPEMIANRVYADRLGNGNEASGDGWRYRGRGLIQVTGKDNYRIIGTGIGVNAVANPELLEEAEYSVASACEFWSRNNLTEMSLNLTGGNEYAVFKKICKRINGGYNGLAERWQLYNLAKRYIV